eukprot:scaffold5653_cov147-Cylindrotheca_fusiformis.AAC.26
MADTSISRTPEISEFWCLKRNMLLFHSLSKVLCKNENKRQSQSSIYPNINNRPLNSTSCRSARELTGNPPRQKNIRQNKISLF